MNRENEAPSPLEQAIACFVLLQDCDDEADWTAHLEWLEADPANAAAYEAVEALWIEADGLHEAQEAIPAEPVADLAVYRALRRRTFLRWAPVAAAAAVAAVVAGPQITRLFDTPAQTYSTDAAHMQDIALADGSKLTLGAATRLTVRIDGSQRTVALLSGQAAFDVRHDAAHPFVITAGGRQVQVLGTEFDVLNRGGAFGVSVRRGLVSVSNGGSGGDVTRLPAGKALLRLAGRDRDEISDVAPDNAIAWKTGQLVYPDSTLAAVARDYERYIGKPVSVAPALQNLHISGVVRARSESDLIRQLEHLLPVRVVNTQDGREIRNR